MTAKQQKEKQNDASKDVGKKLTSDSLKAQLEERVEYHNKLVAEKEKMLGELNKVEQALSQNMGGMNTLKNLQNEYFVKDVPSVNGEA